MNDAGATAAAADRPAPGRLVLVPNTLDLGTGLEGPLTDVLPPGLLQRAAGLGHWAVENAKTTRAFLKRVHALTPLRRPLQEIDIRELPRAIKGGERGVETAGGARGEPPREAWQALLAPVLAGHDLGLLSEAGLPGVADPGAALVALAHEQGIVVEPWSGPSSLTLALAASGLGGQNAAFVGYLPVEPAARAARIRELEALSRRLGQTQLAIETPYRNGACVDTLLATLQPDTRLAIACGLTLPGGWVRMRTVAAWRSAPPRFEDRLPAVFAWQAVATDGGRDARARTGVAGAAGATGAAGMGGSTGAAGGSGRAGPADRPGPGPARRSRRH